MYYQTCNLQHFIAQLQRITVPVQARLYQSLTDTVQLQAVIIKKNVAVFMWCLIDTSGMGTGQGKAKDHSPRRVKGQTAACTKATKFVKEVNGHDDDDWLSSKYHVLDGLCSSNVHIINISCKLLCRRIHKVRRG